MTCGERAGFLFAHACDQPAAWSCARCGKPICYEHSRPAENGYTCISCLRLNPAPRQDQAGNRLLGNDPYFYGNAPYDQYDADDYAAFDGRPEEEHGASGDFGAS